MQPPKPAIAFHSLVACVTLSRDQNGQGVSLWDLRRGTSCWLMLKGGERGKAANMDQGCEGGMNLGHYKIIHEPGIRHHKKPCQIVRLDSMSLAQKMGVKIGQHGWLSFGVPSIHAWNMYLVGCTQTSSGAGHPPKQIPFMTEACTLNRIE